MMHEHCVTHPPGLNTPTDVLTLYLLREAYAQTYVNEKNLAFLSDAKRLYRKYSKISFSP